jgi:hypothetical protein
MWKTFLKFLLIYDTILLCGKLVLFPHERIDNSNTHKIYISESYKPKYIRAYPQIFGKLWIKNQEK